MKQMQTPTPTSTLRNFTRLDDNSAYKIHHYRVYPTSVYLLRPPHSHSSSRPWIITRESVKKEYTFLFRHPLTLKPHSFNFPRKLDFSQLDFTTLATFYSFDEPHLVDKLLILPSDPHFHPDVEVTVVEKGTMLALYGGGHLQGCPRWNRNEYRDGMNPWINLSENKKLKFDDIIVFKGNIYAVNRDGFVKWINNFTSVRKIKIGKNIGYQQRTFRLYLSGWRKRFAVNGGVLYLVVRMDEKMFQVFRLKRQGMRFSWEVARGFEDNKVLFMARDYCFFRKASKKFPGREYKNCIVFSEAAFPQYGNDCWEFTQTDDRQFSEEDIAVFRLGDQVFAREGQNSCFPKIDWSPPGWVINVSLFSTAEFQKHTVSVSSSQSERDPGTTDKNDGEVQSDLKDSRGTDEEEQEEMATDFGGQDQDQYGVESDLDNQDQEDGKMQCDSNIQEMEGAELHVNAIFEGGASLHESVCHVSPSVFSPETGTIVTQTPSLSATEKEITGTVLSLNSGNNATEEETLRNNITELVPGACTFSTTVRQRSDSATAVFEGFDIRPDLVPTLQKIWQKHGNILENSAVRSDDIIARGLESLATIVRILGDNSAVSLNDSQANYLVSTLSDLRYIRFKVDWLIPLVEKAEKLHKSKPLVESLNSLSQLSSQAKKRRLVLLQELTKLDVEENKRKQEMAKVSKMIPFCGQVKFDEPLETGLT